MKHLTLFSLLVLLAGSSFAQVTTSVEFSSYADDNLFRSPEPQSDLLSDIGIKLNYEPDGSNINYYYSGDLFSYRNNSLRNFYVHSLGLNAFNSFGKENKQNVYWGADLTLRLNNEEYNYYDYSRFFAYGNFRFDLGWAFLKTGYNFRYRGYSNLPELTNYRHFLFLQLNKSFITRTTVILEADLGYKSFAGQDAFFESRRGMGRRMEETYSASPQIPSLSQAVFLARITQSLHPKVGLYVQYRRQISLTNQTSFVNSDGYYQDEELFDDPFSFESTSYSSQLTWMMPWSMKFRIGGAFASKSYTSEQAYISAEDSLAQGGPRVDDRSNLYLNLSKVLRFDKNWLEALHFKLNYSYIKNTSNSYWYDYKNSIWGGGIQWVF